MANVFMTGIEDVAYPSPNGNTLLILMFTEGQTILPLIRQQSTDCNDFLKSLYAISLNIDRSLDLTFLCYP